MKKTLLALFLAPILVYAVWVQFPRLQQPEQLASILSSAQNRWDKVRNEAADKEKNGYFSPTFLPYWGRKGLEEKMGSPAGEIIGAWNIHSSLARAERIDHRAKQDDPNYKTALADIEKLEPEMLKSTTMPVFAVPDSAPNFDVLTMNFLAVRATAEAMVGLAENRMAQGRDAEAAQLLNAVMVWGRRLQTQASVLSEMKGVEVQLTGSEAWVGLLGPDAKLTAAQWKEAARILSSVVPDKTQIADCLETEVLTTHTTFTNAPQGALRRMAQEIHVIPLPGYAGRELRIYDNQMIRGITDLQAGKDSDSPTYSNRPGLMDWFSNGQTLLAKALVPKYSEARSLADLSRKRVIGLALVAATRAYLAENKRLPKTLEELVASGIPTPKDLKNDGVLFSSDAKGVIYDLAYTEHPKLGLRRDKVFGQRDWVDEAILGKLSYKISLKS